MLNYTVTPPRRAADLAPATVFAVVFLKDGGYEPRGTGFLLDKPGLFATASHVVGRGGDPVGVVLNDISSMNDYQHAAQAQFRCVPAQVVAFDPIHDLAILYVPDAASSANGALTLSGADGINVGQEVSSFGFPHFNGGRKVLTRFDAKIGAKIMLPAAGVDVKYLVLNSLARPGQSGAPVFKADTNELVAVLSGAYQPPASGVSIMLGGADLSAMSQTTHIVSAEYLRGMY